MSRRKVVAECKTFCCSTYRSRLLLLSRGARLAQHAWFKLTFVLDVLADLKHLHRWALAAARALPFNTSLNPTADSAAFIRETLL
jgi:hypothetical protein